MTTNRNILRERKGGTEDLVSDRSIRTTYCLHIASSSADDLHADTIKWIFIIRIHPYSLSNCLHPSLFTGFRSLLSLYKSTSSSALFQPSSIAEDFFKSSLRVPT
jgi:hypothetical protein